MTHARKLEQYQKTNVGTAGKLDLVIMCYEKAIQFLLHAKAYVAEGEFEKKARVMQRTLDIVEELRNALDFEKGVTDILAHVLHTLQEITHNLGMRWRHIRGLAQVSAQVV